MARTRYRMRLSIVVLRSDRSRSDCETLPKKRQGLRAIVPASSSDIAATCREESSVVNSDAIVDHNVQPYH